MMTNKSKARRLLSYTTRIEVQIRAAGVTPEGEVVRLNLLARQAVCLAGRVRKMAAAEWDRLVALSGGQLA